MEGAIILQEIHTTNSCLIGCVILVFLAAIIFVIGCAFRKFGAFEITLPVTVGMLAIALVLLINAICTGLETTSYLVIVDDSVSFNEFNKVYKIIRYEGNMLRVVLR